MRYSCAVDNSFESWRTAARQLLRRGVMPDEVRWFSAEQQSLLPDAPAVDPDRTRDLKVPAEFIKLAENVACYDGELKWPLLYRTLYRIVFEDHRLLYIESDPDVYQARLMEKAVKRDIHKFHAFVRFRAIGCDDEKVFTAWHEPQHLTVEKAVPFFTRRFGTMRFSILTPKGCAHWDLQELTFTAGLKTRPQLDGDDAEEFWLTYYRSIFNPFRLKLKAMTTEMPRHHWATLPEARLIPELVRQAEER